MSGIHVKDSADDDDDHDHDHDDGDDNDDDDDDDKGEEGTTRMSRYEWDPGQ